MEGLHAQMTSNAALRLVEVPVSVPAKPRRRRYKGRRNPHLGVSIIGPDAGHDYYRLRFRDPDAGDAFRFDRLTDEQAKTAETQRDAAIAKYDALKARRKELAGGAEPLTDAEGLITDAIDLYFATVAIHLRPKTRKGYLYATRRFRAWCEKLKLKKGRHVDARQLRRYYDHVISRPLETGAPRDKGSINTELSWIRAVLNQLAKRRSIAATRAQIDEIFEKLKVKKPRGKFHRQDELRRILAACIAHDAARYKGQLKGRMLPVVLFILLTGMRPEEARLIEWRDVGVDPGGEPAIHVRAEVSKTGEERWVYLAHSPLLAHLVAAPNGRSGLILRCSLGSLQEARTRIAEKHSVEFDCRELRRTCGTYLTCAPSIFRAAAPFMSAAQLGHSVKIAQKHYVNAIRIDPKHRTTEAAMELRIELAQCPQL